MKLLGEIELHDDAPLPFSFNRQEHRYFLNAGQEVPSVTRILREAGIGPDYDGVPPHVIERKSDIGTAFHAAFQYYLEGTLDETSVDPAVLPYLSAALEFVQETLFHWNTCERRFICQSSYGWYAGTYDLEGDWDGVPWLLDFKCTAQPDASWGPQTSAYHHALGLLPKPPFVRQRGVVWLRPQERTRYKLLPYTSREDWRLFRLALEMWYRKRELGK